MIYITNYSNFIILFGISATHQIIYSTIFMLSLGLCLSCFVLPSYSPISYYVYIQCLAKVFKPLHFFHVLCCSLMLNCFILLFFPHQSTLAYTIIAKQKQNCQNFVNLYIYIKKTEISNLAEASLQPQVFLGMINMLCTSAFGNYLPFFSSSLHVSSSFRLDGGRCTFSGFTQKI